MNRKGAMPLFGILVLVQIVGSLGYAISYMDQKGTLKKNGGTIWCKMQNKGADYCNAKYGYNPELNKFE